MTLPANPFSLRMNQEIQRIIGLLRDLYDGQPWHGPSLKAILSGVSVAQANTNPIPGGHSIGEITAHAVAWRTFTAEKLQANLAFDITTPEQDWPVNSPLSDAVWQETLSALATSQQRLLALLATQPDALLTMQVPGRSYNFYVLLHGIIQHDAYHAGQVALLKRRD